MINPIEKKIPGLENRRSNCRSIGTVARGSIAVFVHGRVLDEILDYSAQDLRRETGGFLVGNFYQEGKGSEQLQYVEVQNFLHAKNVVSHSASLTFTHETWSQANHEVHSRFRNRRIVGWHHTHPGLGVFLSAYDRFIHQNFFAQPWQIAMVVDPCQEQFAFYQWRDRELVDCGFVVVSNSSTLK